MIFALVLLPLFWLLGVYVAGEKGRSGWEGFALAFVFGPFGVIVEALLPRREKPASADRSAGDEIAELNELPLVWNDDQISEAEVDRLIRG